MYLCLFGVGLYIQFMQYVLLYTVQKYQNFNLIFIHYQHTKFIHHQIPFNTNTILLQNLLRHKIIYKIFRIPRQHIIF